MVFTKRFLFIALVGEIEKVKDVAKFKATVSRGNYWNYTVGHKCRPIIVWRFLRQPIKCYDFFSVLIVHQKQGRG